MSAPAKPRRPRGHAKLRALDNMPVPSVYDDLALQTEIAALNAEIDDERYRWRCDRPDCDGLPHLGWLHHHARAKQHPPDGRWLIWDLMAGRGFGKTRTGAETSREWGEATPQSIAVIGRKDSLTKEICFEGRSGLLACIPPRLVRSYTKTSGSVSLALTNGTVFRGFSSQVPDNLRGFAYDKAWCDEFSSWNPQNAMDVLDQLMFTMRESDDPRIVVTSTPQRVRQQIHLVDRAVKSPGGLVRLTKGHTDENAANLSDVALELLHSEFDGTRTGAQELGGDLLEDVEGSLWKRWMVDEQVVHIDDLPPMVRIVIAVDPATTVTESSDLTGIVAVGRGEDGRDYVLADVSGKVVGDEAARAVWALYMLLRADEVVYETNQGGKWVRAVLVDTWKQIQREQAEGTLSPGELMATVPDLEHLAGLVEQVDRLPLLELPGGDAPVAEVTATRGKRLRAEPVAARYQRRRVHHVRFRTADGTIVNQLAKLEEQQYEWVPDVDKDSPDRVDALVYGLTRLRGKEGHSAVLRSPNGEGRADVEQVAAEAGDVAAAEALARAHRDGVPPDTTQALVEAMRSAKYASRQGDRRIRR